MAATLFINNEGGYREWMDEFIRVVRLQEEFHQFTPSQELPATSSPLHQSEALPGDDAMHYWVASQLAGQEATRPDRDPEDFVPTGNFSSNWAVKPQFNASQEVDELFCVVSSANASLPPVTPTVLALLTGNDQLNRYTVRSNRR